MNLITKTASERPTMSFSTISGYTPIINGRGLTEDAATIGGRFGASKQFGFLVGASYDWNGRGIDDLEPVPDVATLANGTTMGWKDGMDIREYQYFRSRVGVAGTADARVGPGSDISLRWLYSDFKNYGDRWDYSLVDNTPGIQLLNPGNVGCPTTSAGTTTGPCGGMASYNAQLRNPDIGIGSLVLGGKHALSTALFSWDVSLGGRPMATRLTRPRCSVRLSVRVIVSSTPPSVKSVPAAILAGMLRRSLQSFESGLEQHQQESGAFRANQPSGGRDRREDLSNWVVLGDPGIRR